jgi:heterogeneous nuclear ribonucleoprotein A1/A3
MYSSPLLFCLQDGKHISNEKISRLFVGGLDKDTTDNQLKEHFLPYGNVKSTGIAINVYSGRKRGFGFVQFDDYDIVDRLLGEYDIFVFIVCKYCI